MKSPIWLKPALMGAGAGAVAVAILGFAWGGWMTESKAAELAASKSRMAVVAALVPICLEQSRVDPKMDQTMASLKAASPYERSRMLMDAGWATMPGASDADRSVAQACARELSAQF